MDKQECLEILNQKIDEAQEETDRSPEGSSYGTLMLGRKEAFSYVRGLLKTLDEPEITTEQAWEKIAEEYKLPVETVQQIAGTTISSAVKKEDIAIRDGCIILNPNLTEPEQPEIPKFVAKEIPSAPTEALDRYYNPGVYIVPTYSYKVITWIEEHFDIFLQALVNGFEIQKEPAWVVKAGESYVTSIDYNFYDWTIGTTINKDDESILTFTDKQKAEAVATLVDGTVKEWSE